MSLNLHARDGDVKIPLWQTPTYVSTMICITDRGDLATLTGKDARRALYSYCEWVKYYFRYVDETNISQKELKIQREIIDEHIISIKEHFASKKLVVWCQ